MLGTTWIQVRYAGAVLSVFVGLGLAGWLRPPDPTRRDRVGPVERIFLAPPVPVPDANLARAEELVAAQVAREAFPGAVLAVGNRGLVQRTAGFGRTHWDSAAPSVDPARTQYDLASLTKVVATTAAVMALVEDGRMDLDHPVRRYLPAFSGGDRDRVTIRQLLTHTAGVRAGVVDVPDDSPDGIRRWIVGLPLALEPGRDILYSDIGFALLWLAAERAAGEPLQEYLRRRVWGPLGMTSTAVGVPRGCDRCAPSLYLEEREEPYRGGSYDELGRAMDGVAGNAGAFSTAADLARFAAMMANEGRLGDVRVFHRRTVRGFTQPRVGTRALGWEVYCEKGVVPDHEGCGRVLAFGHTGVTGTSLWIDPETRTWVVLVANRTYLPRVDVEMQPFRRRVFRAVTGRE